MLTKEQEKILRWLLSLKTDIKNTITIGNSHTEYPKGYNDKQIIQKLNEFANLGLITIKWYSTNHTSLNYAVDVTILREGISYFSDKKAAKKENKRRIVESHCAFIISLIALLKSFDNEIIWLLKQLKQLLEQ